MALLTNQNPEKVLCLVSSGSDSSSRCNRNAASIALSTFQWQQEKYTSVYMITQPATLLHLEQFAATVLYCT
jgi:hypothetical protein